MWRLASLQPLLEAALTLEQQGPEPRLSQVPCPVGMDGLQENVGPITPQKCGGGNEGAAAAAAPAPADATGDDLARSEASVLDLPDCVIAEILGESGH